MSPFLHADLSHAEREVQGFIKVPRYIKLSNFSFFITFLKISVLFLELIIYRL